MVHYDLMEGELKIVTVQQTATYTVASASLGLQKIKFKPTLKFQVAKLTPAHGLVSKAYCSSLLLRTCIST